MARERKLPLTITCMECGAGISANGRRLAHLGGAHLATHGMTTDDYQTKYPEAPTFTYHYSRHHAYGSLYGNPEGHMETMTEDSLEDWEMIVAAFAADGYLTTSKAAEKIGISHQGVNRAVLRRSLLPDVLIFRGATRLPKVFYFFSEETIAEYKPQRGIKRV